MEEPGKEKQGKTTKGEPKKWLGCEGKGREEMKMEIFSCVKSHN